MPTLYRGAAARRFTVMTFIVALVLSMLTLFTAPSAYAQSGLPAAPVADTHLDDVPAPPAHAEGNSEDSEGSPRDQQLMNGAPSHPGSQEPADGSTEPDTEHQPAELPAAAKLSGDESGVISGHITLPQEASGAESAWYESLTITAYNDDFGSVVGTVESTGEYSVTGLDAGAYWLRVENHSWSEPTDPDFVNLPRTIFWDGVGTDYVSEPIEVAADSPTVRDMTLPLGRSLSGSVTLSPGADPAWLAGVEIYVNLVTGSGDDRAHHHLDTLRVEEDGSYRIDRLAPGLYTLYLQPEEGDPLTGRHFPGDPGDLEAPLIDLTLGDAVLETVQLERTRVISGTLVPPPGIPASWWDSVMVSTENGSSVQPDENGYFVIDGLEPGKHRLRVTSDSFDINVVSRYFPGNTKAESDAGTYDLTEEAALDVGELVLTAGAVLSGRIEIPSNAPQAWLSQIGVRALPETYKPGNADWVPIGTVDPETGEYTIRGMDDGAYSVQFSPTRWGDEGQDLPNLQGRYLGDTTIFEDARWVSAKVGETVTGLDQSLPFGAVLSGTVTLPPGVDAAQLEAVTVQAMRDSETDDFAPRPQSVDVTSGSYTIVGLPAGNHRIRAEVADWYSGGTDDALPTGLVSRYYDPASRGLDYDSGALLGIAESGEYTGIDFALERGYSITGTVTLEAGAPLEWLEGVSVETSFVDAAGTHYPGYASIREDGTYRVERLPAGEHRVQFLTHEITDEEGTRVMPNLVSEYFSGATQEAAASLVEITEADRIGIDAQLSIGRTISGTVTLPEGVDAEAYDMLSVTAYGVAGAPRAEAWVEPDGQYTIRGLTASEYTVGFSADHVCWDAEPCTGPEVAPQFITVDTATAVDSLLDVTLTRTRSITGQVTLPAGADPEWLRGILVEASPAWHEGSGNEVWREAKVDPETGTYALTHLPEGSYSVRFTVREYVSDAGRVIPPLMSLEWGSTEESGPAAIKVAERDVENIDAKLQSGGKVSGKIASIPAGSNKIVTLTDEFGESYMRPTSPIGIDGSFDFGAVSDGTYRITLYTSTGVQFLRDSAGGTAVTVQNGESQQLELTARTTSSQIAGSGEGLPARSTLGVDLYERLDDTWVKLSGLAAEVSEAGIANYQTQGLAEGTYSVRFGYSVGEWEEWGETYWDQQETLETATPITLTAGQQRADIDLRFDTKPKAFEVAPKPTIQGTAKVGVKLSAQSGAWQPAPTLSYQWLRDGKAIAGATKAEYTPVAGDAGKKVTVAVTGVKSGYVTTERVSAAVTVAPATTVKPGKPVVKKPFTDIPANRKFAKEINWMYNSGLSTGTKVGNTAEYRPMEEVSREAMAAFLYRLEGAKSKGLSTSPFVDVKPGQKFYKEISWMYEQGLSTGSIRNGKRYYDPKASVSREAMAAFLYRLTASGAKPGAGSPFADIPAGRKFAKEINWMYSSGLSTGTKTGNTRLYKPKDGVSREAMAAFMYRMEN